MARRTLLVAALLVLTAGPLLAASAAASASVAPGDATPQVRAAATCAHATPSHDEPSHLAPPARIAVRGYTLAYCSDFTGSSLPWGWDKFSGVPKGDPSGYFEPRHVHVRNGILEVDTSKDPGHGNVWATGGVCHCGAHRTYGAFFVRSRSIGVGPDNVELLWPVAHVWTPAIDFTESSQLPFSSTWTVHYGPGDQRRYRTAWINLLGWHTWGVYWTPRSLTFTVDGFVWGTVKTTAAVPAGAMTLDIQSQTYCGLAPECPTAPASLQVDWVEEFARA